MEVFISWSGNKSKVLAEILKDWFPAVIQAVKPYFTPDDISKGTHWGTEISKKLEACRIGIICLTSENYNAPWILFEAGALSKNIDKSHVCPILFDLEAADISGPLVQFQFTQFTKEDIKRLVKMINAELDNDAIAENILNDIFEMWWPKLEERVEQELSKKEKNSVKTVARPDRELLEELLVLVRSNSLSSNSGVSLEVVKDLVENYVMMVDLVLSNDIDILNRPLRSMYKPIYFLTRKNPRSALQIQQIREAGVMIGAAAAPFDDTLRRVAARSSMRSSSNFSLTEEKNEEEEE